MTGATESFFRATDFFQSELLSCTACASPAVQCIDFDTDLSVQFGGKYSMSLFHGIYRDKVVLLLRREDELMQGHKATSFCLLLLHYIGWLAEPLV